MARRAVVLTEDVERSIFDQLTEALSRHTMPVHRPGEIFDGSKHDVWCEPRIQSYNRAGPTSRNGASSHPMRWSILVYRRVGSKGKQFGSLSAAVDEVRRLVDYSAGAPALLVRNERRESVASVQWGEADEDRQHNIAITVQGVAHQGFDVATLSVVAQLTTT